MVTITEEEYQALHDRAKNAEDRYDRLTKELNIFFRDSDIKIIREPQHFNREYIYVRLEADKLDGKLRGFFEHIVRTRGHHR